MPRVKRGVTAHARHKKILKQAKGYRGARGNVYRVAKQAVIKAGQYAYRDRRQKKRQLWIIRTYRLFKSAPFTVDNLIRLLSSHMQFTSNSYTSFIKMYYILC